MTATAKKKLTARKSKTKIEMVSQAEFARRSGCSRPYVSKLVKAGKIKLQGKLIDFEKASTSLEQTTNPALKQSAGNQTSKLIDFQEARTKREQFDAKLRELNYMERAGQLVNVAEVKRAQFAHDRMIRSRIEAIPGRFSPHLVSMKSERKIREYLADELRQILEEMADASRTC